MYFPFSPSVFRAFESVNLHEIGIRFSYIVVINEILKATFHLTISMRGQRATGKLKRIIITGVAGLFNG